MPEDKILLQLRSAQVEVPMPKPQLFCWQRLTAHPRHGNGGRRCGPHDLEAVCSDFHVSSRQLCVSHLRGTRDDLPLDEDDAFRSQRCRETHGFRWCITRVEGDLYEPSSVAEVEEYELAEIALAMHPAAESDIGAGIGGPERAACMTSK